MKKALSRIGWPLLGFVCLGIALGAVIEATKEEGINALLLVFCAVGFTCGVIGTAIKTRESWQ